ncbi:MAG: membrane protein insertion efficiency factor YidD, partial [Chthoniobacterales bacterium]
GGPDSGCRFWPTCSEYLLEAVEQHGFWRGSWFGAKRLLRCQPWGGSGFDPVPLSAAASDSEWVRKQGRGYNCRCASR